MDNNDWVDWSKFAFSSVLEETGFHPYVLQFVWLKYCGMGTPIPTPNTLYLVYLYIHMFPRRSQAKRVLRCTRFTLQYTVLPALHYLALVMNEIYWNDRLDYFNHTPHFPFLFTGMVDTFPMHVQAPSTREIATALCNPKYNGYVFKGQLGIDFLGRIIICTGLHLGTCYDGHIWNRTGARKLLPWEWWLGDGAYIANTQFLAPYRKHNGGLLPEEEFVNSIISHYRARVEHINHLFEMHAVFQGKFRGSVSLLRDCFYVVAHTTNIHLRTHPRYPAYGPWPHVG